MLDTKQYNVGVPAEDYRRYCAGGFHPIHLGDYFKDGRYEILNKLGFGSFSTVWLAKDHLTAGVVSIKVVDASESTKKNHELEVLKHLQANDDRSSHPGCSNVAQLLDSFVHEGPNGQHLCLVMEPLGPTLFHVAQISPECRLKADLARHVSGQIVKAVAYLHSCGVTHGDIHTGNILFRLPETAIAGLLSESPVTGEMSRKDGSPLEKGIPKYLVEPLEYDITAFALDIGDIQLVDFGSAFFYSSPRETIDTVLGFNPPELVFKRPLTEAVDIWNLGCTLYEVVLGRMLFDAGHNQELIPQHCTVLGAKIPAEWIREGIATGLLLGEPEDWTDYFLPLEEEIKRHYFDESPSEMLGKSPRETLEFTEQDLEKLGKYLRRMLVIDPEQRAVAAELVSDASWVNAND